MAFDEPGKFMEDVRLLIELVITEMLKRVARPWIASLPQAERW